MKKRLLLLYIMFAGLLTGCSKITILDPKSSTGKDQAYLIWLSLAIMAFVLLVVFVLFTIFVIKYRYTKERKYVMPKDVKGNKKLEMTYTITPIFLLIILIVPTVKITLEQSPSTEASKGEEGVHIDVTARQFEWIFKHENDKEETDELVLPEEKPIIFHLKSEDVIHSFWVPELAGKIDVMPDREMIYIIKNPEKGEYEGKCAEFCGVQHGNMTFDVKVVSESDYDDYLEDSE